MLLMRRFDNWLKRDQVKGDDVGGTCSIHDSCDNEMFSKTILREKTTTKSYIV